MGFICEHMFEKEDPRHPGYSDTEYDLYRYSGLTLRKNLRSGIYEFVKIDTGEIVYTVVDLQEASGIANLLEEQTNTVVKCFHGRFREDRFRDTDPERED